MKKIVPLIFLAAFNLFVCCSENPEELPILNYGLPQEPVSLDPATTADHIYYQIAFNIFEPLIRLNWETGDFDPALAIEWHASPDRLSWQFSLRPNVIFHDGAPLNAEAVKVSFERQLDPSSPYYREGATNVHGQHTLNMIKEIRIIDDLTVEFILHYPYSAFLHTLASPLIGTIVSRKALDTHGDSSGRHPIGTGPLKFNRWKRGETILLEKFDRYWGEPSSLHQVVYSIEPLIDERVKKLKDGHFDIISGLSPSHVRKIDITLGILTKRQKLIGTTFVGLHIQKPPLDRLEIRKAILACFDDSTKRKIVDGVSHDLAEPAFSLMPWSEMNYGNSPRQKADSRYLSKNIVLDDGANDTKTKLKLDYFIQTDSLQDHWIVRVFKTNLEKIGWQIEFEAYCDWEKYKSQALGGKSGHFFWDGWLAYSPHPDHFLYPLFYSHAIHNFFQYSNPQVDQLLDQARRTMDVVEQCRLYQKVEEIILNDVPVILISHPNAVYAIRDRVKNLRVDPLAIPWLHEVRF